MSPVKYNAAVLHPPHMSLYSHTPHLPFKFDLSRTLEKNSLFCMLSHMLCRLWVLTLPKR